MLVILAEAAAQPSPELGFPFWASMVVGLLGLIGGGAGLAAVLRVRAQNKLSEAEAVDAFESTRASILEMINEGTETLRGELASARERIRELQSEVEVLRQKLDRDHATKRINVLERDVLFWRTRTETLQNMIDASALMGHIDDRRQYDEGPPEGLGYDRRGDNF